MKLVIEEVKGRIIGNPNNIIIDFEEQLLKYIAGESWEDYNCVITDSCTNAFKSCLFYNEVLHEKKLTYDLPQNTYISMYMALQDYPDLDVNLQFISWDKYYRVGNIIDSAVYLPENDLDRMFTEGVEFILLSFGNKKPLANNRGGAIIFKKDKEKYNFFKRYTHNGRDSAITVEDDSLLIDYDSGNLVGERYNLVPEQVKTLSQKLETKIIQKVFTKWHDYPNIKVLLSKWQNNILYEEEDE